MKYKSIIFDFNGTLIWDTEHHNQALDIFLEQHQIVLSNEEKHNKVHGRLNREIFMDIFNQRLSEEQIQAYTLEKELIYQDLFTKTKLTFAPGVVGLFQSLLEKEIPFTIATASGIENVEFFIKKLHLSDWFDTSKIIYNDGTMRGKPFPDLFLRAMEVIKAKPSECIIFEDSLSGIQAAEAAEAGKIIIVNSNNEVYPLWENKHQIITSFDQINLDTLLN